MSARSELSTLLAMLTYKRPAWSIGERDFIDRFIATLPDVAIDGYGNYHVTIGESPLVLWSAHTDSVHHHPGRQNVSYDPESGIVKLSKRAKRGKRGSNCLGADDAAGVFILREMILAQVSGHYIFHRAEEIGGRGSDWIASRNPSVVSGLKYAIAFDRRGYGDVITWQSGGRCCSELFAQSMADYLNIRGLSYAPCDRGVFTDTANYTDLIGECTNLSVGYADEHRKDEQLDVRHVFDLLSAMLALDPSTLVSARQPGERETFRQVDFWYGTRRANPHGWRKPDSGYITNRDLSSSDYHDRVVIPMYDTDPADRIKIVDGVDVSQAYLFGECHYCGKAYHYDDSTADEYECYCSDDCEQADWHLIKTAAEDRRPTRVESVYLDPQFDAINDALDKAWQALRRRTH